MIKLVKDERNEKEKGNLYVTPKALAMMAAIESGLLPEVEGGWDDTKFQIFWNRFVNQLSESGFLIFKICKD